MPIVTCNCGCRYSANASHEGLALRCNICGGPIFIPSSGTSTQVDSLIANCQCGQSFKAEAHLAGSTVSCPACHHPLQIPSSRNAVNDDEIKVASDLRPNSLLATGPVLSGERSSAPPLQNYSPSRRHSRPARPQNESFVRMVSLLACTLGVFILFHAGYLFSIPQNPQDNRNAALGFFASLEILAAIMVIVVFGVAAIRGANTSQNAKSIRSKGAVRAFTGLGMVVLAVLIGVVGVALRSPILFLAHGLFAVGFVTAIVGTSEAITGHNLLGHE